MNIENIVPDQKRDFKTMKVKGAQHRRLLARSKKTGLKLEAVTEEILAIGLKYLANSKYIVEKEAVN